MIKHFIQIDVSNSRYESYDDSIKIQIGKEEEIQVNFSKFVSQSKFVRDKYKYSEAIYSIPIEIEKMREENNISSESIKYFIQLIQDEKVKIPIECYKDIYSLSEYFLTPKFSIELDKIREEELCKDINFSIQILLDSEQSNDYLDSKLTIKVENFLSERINECIENSKFKELEISRIFRILELSEKCIINSNSLFEFIVESSSTRYILFKFIELHKLIDDKLDEFIEFIENEDEETKEIYFEFIPFNILFIKNMKNKYNQLFNEMNKIKEELKQVKEELNKSNDELNETKEELNEMNKENKQEQMKHEETKQKLNNTEYEIKQEQIKYDEIQKQLKQVKEEIKEKQVELNKSNDELKETKKENDELKQEIKQEKIMHEKTNEELIKFKSELKQIEDEMKRIKNENKQKVQAILVGGEDSDFILGEKPNNKNKDDCPIISPPVKSLLNPSSLLSFSSYSRHSVAVTRGGSLMGVGSNKDGRISSSLSKSVIDHFTEFCIKDNSGHELVPVSAVCCLYGTLYMFTKSDNSGRQLVLCDKDINGGTPVFLDIGNHQPVSLFGGRDHSAAICTEGEVIFINRYSIKNSPSSRIEAVSLPGYEKASNVACCDDSVVVLSSNGRIFESPVKNEGKGSDLKFSSVKELIDKEIVCVSGIRDHCLAVSKEGLVFGRGSNKYGQLGLGQEIKSTPTFTEISSLKGYEIRAAYAGFGYSFFKTREGKILTCGSNTFSELFLSSGPGENVYALTETTITDGATFCIAGDSISAIFISIDPPPNTPNMRIMRNE